MFNYTLQVIRYFFGLNSDLDFFHVHFQREYDNFKRVKISYWTWFRKFSTQPNSIRRAHGTGAAINSCGTPWPHTTATLASSVHHYTSNTTSSKPTVPHPQLTSVSYTLPSPEPHPPATHKPPIHLHYLTSPTHPHYPYPPHLTRTDALVTHVLQSRTFLSSYWPI